MPLGPYCKHSYSLPVMEIGPLWMLLIRLHCLASPPDQTEIPHFKSALQDRYGEEARVVVVVRFLVLVGRAQCCIFGLIESSYLVSLTQGSLNRGSLLSELGEVEFGVCVLLEQVVPGCQGTAGIPRGRWWTAVTHRQCWAHSCEPGSCLSQYISRISKDSTHTAS